MSLMSKCDCNDIREWCNGSCTRQNNFLLKEGKYYVDYWGNLVHESSLMYLDTYLWPFGWSFAVKFKPL